MANVTINEFKCEWKQLLTETNQIKNVLNETYQKNKIDYH